MWVKHSKYLIRMTFPMLGKVSILSQFWTTFGTHLVHFYDICGTMVVKWDTSAGGLKSCDFKPILGSKGDLGGAEVERPGAAWGGLGRHAVGPLNN